MSALVETTDASFELPAMSAARGVTLSIAPGEMVVVTGPEGSGKSTLLRGLLGLAPLTGGSATVLGADLRALSHEQWTVLRARCAYASWTAPLMSNLTLFDNLAVPLLMRSVAESSTRQEVARMLERFGLAELATRRPPELRTDKHRSALVARALLVPADLLLVDDAPESPLVDAALTEACANGQAVLLSSRRPERFSQARQVRLLAPSTGAGDVDDRAAAVR